MSMRVVCRNDDRRLGDELHEARCRREHGEHRQGHGEPASPVSYSVSVRGSCAGGGGVERRGERDAQRGPETPRHVENAADGARVAGGGSGHDPGVVRRHERAESDARERQPDYQSSGVVPERDPGQSRGCEDESASGEQPVVDAVDVPAGDRSRDRDRDRHRRELQPDEHGGGMLG